MLYGNYTEAGTQLTRSLRMPSSGNATSEQFIEDVGSVVIVGANGSGKSRLGVWIENHAPDGRETHRISAQRALTFNPNIPQKPIESARKTFLYGDDVYGDLTNRVAFRWGKNPTSHVLNDYDALLSLLYALDRQRDSEVVSNIRRGLQYTNDTIPESELDYVKKIWAEALPHRDLVTTNDAVRACISDGEAYDGNEMSDGERVALYLIGEVMCAPQNTVLVIDEPEIHLHKAIQGRLWDALENARIDCTFVHITHDLDFASGRNYSKKIWLESFDGTHWVWNDIPEYDDFPSAMVFEILGSRQPILFVEGEYRSLDRIYRTLFPLHTIVPRGSCFAVIRSVRAMSQPGIFSNHKAFGLIDRDRRSSEEISALEREGVFSCPVAEVENLLCIPEILHAAANTLNNEDKANEAINFAIEQFQNEVDRHAVSFAYKSIQFSLGRFEENKRWTKNELAQAFSLHVSNIDVETVYNEEKSRLQAIADSGDLMEILQVFNRKGLVNQLAEKLGFKSAAYQMWLFRQLEKERHEKIENGLLNAMKAYLPLIPTN